MNNNRAWLFADKCKGSKLNEQAIISNLFICVKHLSTHNERNGSDLCIYLNGYRIRSIITHCFLRSVCLQVCSIV